MFEVKNLKTASPAWDFLDRRDAVSRQGAESFAEVFAGQAAQSSKSAAGDKSSKPIHAVDTDRSKKKTLDSDTQSDPDGNSSTVEPTLIPPQAPEPVQAASGPNPMTDSDPNLDSNSDSSLLFAEAVFAEAPSVIEVLSVPFFNLLGSGIPDAIHGAEPVIATPLAAAAQVSELTIDAAAPAPLPALNLTSEQTPDLLNLGLPSTPPLDKTAAIGDSKASSLITGQQPQSVNPNPLLQAQSPTDPSPNLLSPQQISASPVAESSAASHVQESLAALTVNAEAQPTTAVLPQSDADSNGNDEGQPSVLPTEQSGADLHLRSKKMEPKPVLKEPSMPQAAGDSPAASALHKENSDSGDAVLVTAAAPLERNFYTKNTNPQDDRVPYQTVAGAASAQDNASDGVQVKSQPITVSGSAKAETIDTIVRHVATAHSRGESRVQIRLEPPELGTLRIDIRQQENTMVLRFETTNPRTQQLLQQSVNDLKASLDSQGFVNTQIDVQLRSDAKTPASNPQSQPDFNQNQQQNNPQRQSHHDRQADYYDWQSLESEPETGPLPDFAAAGAPEGRSAAGVHRWQDLSFRHFNTVV